MSTLFSPALERARHTGSSPGRLISAEIMKIRTTSAWWIFSIGMLAVTGLALTINGFNHHYNDLHPPYSQMGADQQAEMHVREAAAHTPAGLAKITADMMTSGQFFGVLFALIIGILVITNEFNHQTATATFMTNPHRSRVILSKLVAAAVFGALFWLISTVIDAIVTPIYLHSQHVSSSITDWIPVRSVLLNLLAFVMWAIFGCGLGTMIRSQIASVVTGMAVYLIGFVAVALIFNLIHNVYPHDWILGAQVIAPAVASMVMTTPGSAFDHAPPQWAGAVVMVAYTVTFTLAGIALARKRDIS
jgi:ABC-type transport system involved in multi-copper enzyme maturation permease subunit